MSAKLQLAQRRDIKRDRPVYGFVASDGDGTCPVRVVVLRTTLDVDHVYKYKHKKARRAGERVVAFFVGRRVSGCVGTIVLGVDGAHDEDIPHECTHAAVHYLKCRDGGPINEEELATLVGELSAAVVRGLRRQLEEAARGQ